MSGHNHYTSGTVRSRSDLTLTRFGWLALIALCVPATGALAQPTGEEISACVQKMNETFLRKGWVGITPEYADDGSIVVKHVFADSPAAKAGMREEDIVRGLDGHDRKSAPDKFMKAYDSLRPDQTIEFNVERQGTRLTLSVLVEPIPEAVLEHWIQEECGSADRANQ